MKMCYRLAAELSNRIAAIGPVAGHLGVDEFAEPPPKPIPIIHFHGRLDSWARYDGGSPWPHEEEEGLSSHTVSSQSSG